MISKYMKIRMANLSIELTSWKIFKIRECKEIFRILNSDAVDRKNRMKFTFM